MSIAFDLGGIPFAILAGYVADRLLGRRRILVACV
jgi:sugar phosphate permease